MFDDFPLVSSYCKLYAQFPVGRSRLTELVGYMSFFFNFLLGQLLTLLATGGGGVGGRGVQRPG